MAAVASANNRFELFLATPSGVEHFWNDGAGGWLTYGQPYQPGPIADAGNAFGKIIAAARDNGGRLCVAWIARGEVYFAAAPGAGTSLNVPGSLVYGTQGTVAIDIAMNADGRLELFTRDGRGQLRSRLQEVAGAWSWGPANGTFGAHDFRDVAVTPSGDGRLSLFAITRAGGHLRHYRQTSPGVWVNQWTDLAGADLKQVVAKQSIDRRLEVFARGGNDVIYHRYEYEPGKFTEFLPLSLPITAGWQVAVDGSGRIQVISQRGSPEKLWNRFQVTANGGWEEPLGYQLYPAPAPVSDGFFVAATAPDGRVGLFEYVREQQGQRRVYFSLNTRSEPHQQPQWSERQLVHAFPAEPAYACQPGVACAVPSSFRQPP
jgi:hypothetical protein